MTHTSSGGTGRPRRKASKSSNGSDFEGAEPAGKGAISQLQEFVQGSKLFPLPPSCPILQWTYDTRMADSSLEFRATVAFLLDGVPHHVVGSWQPSKKLAQRDAAERSLGLLVGCWGSVAGLGPPGACTSPVQEVHHQTMAVGKPAEVVAEAPVCAGPPLPQQCRALEEFCRSLAATTGEMEAPAPSWSYSWDPSSGLCRSTVRIELFAVPHTFSGKPCPTQEAAAGDTAQRVLWYFQRPGFETAYELDPDCVRAAASEIPAPCSSWTKEALMQDSDGRDAAATSRNPSVLRIQTRLQQAFGHKLGASSESTLVWSFDRDERQRGRGATAPLYRATAHVPVAGRTFSSGWFGSQREAQVDACTKISDYLDCELSRAA